LKPLPGAFFVPKAKSRMQALIAFILILLLAAVPGGLLPARIPSKLSAQATVSGPPAVGRNGVPLNGREQATPDRQAVDGAIGRAVAWLHSQQLPDGGFSGAPGNPSSAAATSDAVFILARLGEDPAGKDWTVDSHSALDALAALTPAYVGTDAGQAGKIARAVAVAGADARSVAGLDVIGVIQADYDPASGRYNPDLLFRHTLAVEGLALARVTVPPAAFDALLVARRADGSWFWSFDASASDVDTTGRVLQTLARYGGMHCSPALVPSLDFLAKQQTGDGWATGSVPGPANANSTALAVAGLIAAGLDPAKIRPGAGGPSALESLLAFQEPSGAFVYTRDPAHQESRLVATLDALDALAEFKDNGQACKPFYLPVHLAGASK
jgi:hypothetical protein